MLNNSVRNYIGGLQKVKEVEGESKMTTLTEIWNMPRSKAIHHLCRIYKVDVTKPKEERKATYKVSLTRTCQDEVSVEADSEEEATTEAMDELGVSKWHLVGAKIK